MAPVSMVASSALAALSLACQPFFNIKRSSRLVGPISVFVLVVADSGDRKTTCDGHFTKPLRDYEDEQRRASKSLLRDFQSAMNAWESKVQGVKDGIRTAAKSGKDTTSLERSLRELEHEKPERPRVPRIIYENFSVEKLNWSLATEWPSGGVLSNEGGLVFGSHSMGSDSLLQTLAVLNKLWDGTTITIDRRTSESFTVKGARLTISLQIQEGTLRAFSKQSGNLARASGLLARMLFAKPDSLAGERIPLAEAPETWVCLDTYNDRIKTILNRPVTLDKEGGLVPEELAFSIEAKARWMEFRDQIERELSPTGRYRDVCDFGGKAADIGARLSALFHIYDGCEGTSIGADHVHAGTLVARWHLDEALRFWGEMSMPIGLANASRLESWVLERCSRNNTESISTKEVLQYGPNQLRDKETLAAAMLELEELGRARRVSEGKRRLIEVNPVLLRNKGAATAISATARTLPVTCTPSVPAAPAVFPMAPEHRTTLIGSNYSNSEAARMEIRIPELDRNPILDEMLSGIQMMRGPPKTVRMQF
jgi:putative DNA primase/helicase